MKTDKDNLGYEEGNICPHCSQKITKIELLDLRLDSDKEKYPLTEEQKFTLNCRCFHFMREELF